MYYKVLWGTRAKSMELIFPKVDFVVDDRWEKYSLKTKIILEVYWRLMLKKPFSKVCFSSKILEGNTYIDYDVILGDIFRREEILPIAERYGYILNRNLFEAFSLSPEYLNKNKGVVTDEEVRKKDYEEDNLKCSIMASLIDSDVESICDIGSGSQILKTLISPGVLYYGVDYIDKSQEFICDFNKYQFPEIKVDCYFVCGILEFVTDYKWFLKRISKGGAKYIILSYSAREFSSFTTYRSPVYHNCIYSCEIVSLICRNGYELEKIMRYKSRQVILKFKKIAEALHDK